MKKTVKIFIGVIVLAGLLWIFYEIKKMTSLSGLFTPKEVVAENSPVTVKQIQALAQLVTVSMYDEIVTDTSMPGIQNIRFPFLPGMRFYQNQNILVVIAKTTVHVGIDMQQLNPADISGTADSLHLLLPPAEVLDVVVNPSGVEVFIEDGEWNSQAMANLKNKIKTIAAANAQSRGLLTHSQNKAEQILSDFFKAAGYKKVMIDFKWKPASLE